MWTSEGTGAAEMPSDRGAGPASMKETQPGGSEAPAAPHGPPPEPTRRAGWLLILLGLVLLLILLLLIVL